MHAQHSATSVPRLEISTRAGIRWSLRVHRQAVPYSDKRRLTAILFATATGENETMRDLLVLGVGVLAVACGGAQPGGSGDSGSSGAGAGVGVAGDAGAGAVGGHAGPGVAGGGTSGGDGGTAGENVSAGAGGTSGASTTGGGGVGGTAGTAGSAGSGEDNTIGKCLASGVEKLVIKITGQPALDVSTPATLTCLSQFLAADEGGKSPLNLIWNTSDSEINVTVRADDLAPGKTGMFDPFAVAIVHGGDAWLALQNKCHVTISSSTKTGEEQPAAGVTQEIYKVAGSMKCDSGWALGKATDTLDQFEFTTRVTFIKSP